MLSRDQLEDEIRRHRQFLRKLYKLAVDDPFFVAEEIEKFLRIIEQ